MRNLIGTDADWDITLPGETTTAKLFRTLLAQIAHGFEEHGCPLTDEQAAVFAAIREAVSS